MNAVKTDQVNDYFSGHTPTKVDQQLIYKAFKIKDLSKSALQSNIPKETKNDVMQ